MVQAKDFDVKKSKGARNNDKVNFPNLHVREESDASATTLEHIIIGSYPINFKNKESPNSSMGFKSNHIKNLETTDQGG